MRKETKTEEFKQKSKQADSTKPLTQYSLPIEELKQSYRKYKKQEDSYLSV